MNAPKFDLAALKNIDFSKVIAIAKQRGILIACVLIIVVIPLVAWWFRGGIKDSIHETMSKRSKEFDKIVSLEKSSITVRNPVGDPKSETVSLNSTLIDALKARNESLENEVKGVYSSALEHNKKNHDIVQTKQVVFPKPLQENEKLLEEIFLPVIGPAYTVLLANNRVNTPPSSADVLEAVKQREISFIRDDLKKKNRSEVTDPKEIEQLAQALSKARLDALLEGARDTAVYLDNGAIRMPPAKGFISVDTCFTWQWDLWVLDDIFHAISNVNTNVKEGVKSSVISAPVKRIISIRIDQPSSVAAASATAEAPPVEPEATDAPEEATEPAAVVAATTDATGEPIAPASEIIRDFKISFTGLKSCQLYDIRNVKLKLIVSTSDLPKVLDLARRPNVVIRVSGACTLSREPYPFTDIWDPLARLFDAWGLERCLWGKDWTRAYAILNYEQGVEPFLRIDRLSDSERAMLMGGACAKAYAWSPQWQ